VTDGARARYDDSRVHAWVLGALASEVFALHHAHRLYVLYVAPADARLSGFALAVLGMGIGAALARRLAPLADRLAPWMLYVLALAAGSSGFAAFAAFPLGAWASRIACVCIGLLLCASTVTAATAYRAAGRASTALGLVPFTLRPFRLAGALLALIAVEAGAARAGVLLGGVLLSVVIVVIALSYVELYSLLYGVALPGLGPLRMTGVALMTAALACLYAAEKLAPLGELSRFPDEVVFRTDAGGPTYTVVASPAGYELFCDGQLAIASLDEHRRTRALVAPALRLSPSARRVLLLNGGLGTVEREILRDARVEELVVVVPEPTRLELARNVAFLSKRTDGALDSPRLRIVLSEPLAWLARAPAPATERPDRFDVIIADFPWPLGYGEGKLYTHYAFSRLAARLSTGGVAVVPGASGFSAPAAFAEIVATLESTGLHIAAYHVPVPTLGVASFVVGSAAAIDQAALRDVKGIDFGLDLEMPAPGRISTLHDESVVAAMEEARERN
jgi:spermidine synthase